MAIKRVKTPQGGVLSPLLWLLVINRMLKMFDGKASKLITYSDDVAITVKGECLSTLSSIMNSILQDLGMGTKYRSGYQRGENGYGTLYK